MTTVEVGNNERLAVEPRRNMLSLIPAVAGARIELQFSVATVTPNPKVSAGPFHFTADLYVSRVAHHNQRMACQLTAEHVVTPTAQGSQMTLTGFVSAEQLREIEELRAGEYLELHLVLAAATTVDGILHRFRGDEHVTVSPGEWGPQLDRVDAAAYVELLVPMPTAEPYATATRRIREARELLRANDVDGTLGRIRLALDAVRDELDTLKVMQAAPKAARERTLQERIAVFVEAAYSMLSGAQHDDDLTKTFRYTRTHAAMMITTVAGLVRDASENPVIREEQG